MKYRILFTLVLQGNTVLAAALLGIVLLATIVL